MLIRALGETAEQLERVRSAVGARSAAELVRLFALVAASEVGAEVQAEGVVLARLRQARVAGVTR